MKPINFFPRFKNLNLESINVDFHLHSTWTDGKNTVSEIINSAQNNQLNSIAITDHIRIESEYFDNYESEIKSLNSKTDLNIYLGFEAKIADFNGNIDVKDNVVKRADIAIASVHRFPLGSKLYKASEFKKNISQEIELELSLAALNKGGFNVLGHAGGMSMTHFREFPSLYFEEIISKCCQNEIAFDLSGRYHIKVLSILYPLLEKYNSFICIGSDSHAIKPMGRWNRQLKEDLL
jgi:putative hydrolase